MVRKNDLRRDLIHFRLQGVGLIINLLNKYDLRVVGVNLSEYQNLCKELGITLISFPIQDMAPPTQEIEEFEEELIGRLSNIIIQILTFSKLLIAETLYIQLLKALSEDMLIESGKIGKLI